MVRFRLKVFKNRRHCCFAVNGVASRHTNALRYFGQFMLTPFLSPRASLANQKQSTIYQPRFVLELLTSVSLKKERCCIAPRTSSTIQMHSKVADSAICLPFKLYTLSSSPVSDVSRPLQSLTVYCHLQS